MTNTLNVGVVMDSIASIKYHKDTTLALLLAAQTRGHRLYYMEIDDLFLQQGEARASCRPLKVYQDEGHWFDLADPEDWALGDLDVVLMRKDPPFNQQFIYATYVLEQAEQSGTLVVNKPQSLRDCNEKVFATHFPNCCPPVLVSSDSERLKQFHHDHQDVIFKPLDGMGGKGIFRCQAADPNIGVILETLIGEDKQFIMAQKFLPEISLGDKRVLVVDGKAIPYALARIPAQGETRGNLAAGGSGHAQPLSKRDLWIVDQVAPTLKARGLMFVGLDIIGDYLTEINVTSPTCVREIDRAYNTNIGAALFEAVETKIRANSTLQ